ncbi:MAG: ABC transporter ATP-binding protein, partial [Gammaproteobacteria bacterium]|nr:ABC transporter ATP-binding protein [Gammaproteobacteria bacterium]
VREMIRSLSKEKIVIISTHILEEVSAVCTRAVIISQGRILADATPAELEARSKFHQAVSLRLRQADDAAKVVPVLREMPEVAGLAQEGAQVTLFPAQTDGRLLMAVTERIHDNQWSVDAVFLERGHMDEVFREITQGELS